MFPYDGEVLASIQAHYNAAIWPAQAVALALALVALWLAVPPRRGSGRLIGCLLAAAWLWCGLVYFLQHVAPYDFMAPIYGWLFIAEALLLVWLLVWRDIPLLFRPGLREACGLSAAVFALFGLPLIDGLGAGGYAATALVGLAPGPTALFTLGLLALAPRRFALPLMILPLLWCLAAGARGWALDLPADWPLPLLGIALLGLSWWRGRQEG